MARSKLSNFVLHKRVWNMHKMDHMAAVDMTTKWKDGLIFLKKCGRHQLTTYCNDCISDLSSYRLLQQTPIRFYSSTVHSGWCGTQKSRWIKSEKMDCVDSTNWPMQLGDGEFLWTVNYHGHFFSKCPNSSGIFQRMNILDIFDEFLRTFFVHQSSSS